MDKLLHMMAGYGLALTLGTAHVRPAWTAPLVFSVGVARELTQQPRNSTPEALKDLGAFTTGLAAAMLVDEVLNRGPERHRRERAAAGALEQYKSQFRADSAAKYRGLIGSAYTAPVFSHGETRIVATKFPR